MRRVLGVASSIVTGLLVAGGSGQAVPAAPPGTTTTAPAPVAATTSAQTSTSAPAPALHGMQALFCPSQSVGGWLSVDPVARQLSAAPVVEADCAASNVDRVFRYSRGFAYQAITARGTDGITVGYVPSGQTNTNGLVDAGGRGAGNTISTPLFNPVTGDLWWGQDGHLFSNAVPPTAPSTTAWGRCSRSPRRVRRCPHRPSARPAVS